jgi:TPR repeat protein
MRLVLPLLMVAIASSVQAQITIDLSHPGTYVRHFTVTAADGDASAITPDQIADVNRKLAASGNTEAAWELGLAYLQGEGVKQDLTQAEHWFELGATKPEQKGLVAEMYQKGEYFTPDLETAARWFIAAGRPGDLFELAQSYRTSDPPQIHKAATLYRSLLSQTGHPEVRRAQMELGNLVLDGKYSAGDDVAGHALNMEWARVITQELLGQEEYSIAVDYTVGREDLPKNHDMWQLFCKRAARYNIDLAQEFYGRAILNHEIQNGNPFEGYAWIRLASDKQYGNKVTVQQLEKQMTPEQLAEANSIYDGLVQTRIQDGAYYPAGDPLREPSNAALKALPEDNPDVQLRQAFALESSSRPGDYQKALQLYRVARDRRMMDVRFVLGHDYLEGTNGIAKDPAIAQHWLYGAADAGYHPAALLLARLCRGEGGGNPDAVQALAWEMIGHDGPTAIGPPPHLSQKQKLDAMHLYAKWLAAHPGWTTAAASLR